MRAILRFFSKALQRVAGRVFYPVISEALRDVLGNQLAKHSQLSLVASGDAQGPLDLFVLQNHLFKRDGHFSWSYEEWRMRRISKILEIFGLDFFKGKKILELGGGIGDMGAFFASLGAEVYSAEYRVANRNLARIRYRNIAGFRSIFCDAEEEFTHLLTEAGVSRFDLILCTGFLEVIENVDNVMSCCMKMGEDVILETMVCDSTDPERLLVVDMGDAANDHPTRGKSGRPSPAYIEKFFERGGWIVGRHFSSDLNTTVHIYDWEHANDGSVDPDHKRVRRRFWHFKRG